jgi:hypothetical protein
MRELSQWRRALRRSSEAEVHKMISDYKVSLDDVDAALIVDYLVKRTEFAVASGHSRMLNPRV